jgi:hypothetical protein
MKTNVDYATMDCAIIACHYLSTYILDLFPTELVTKVKPNFNSVEVHPQLSYNRRPMDGVLVGAGSLWPLYPSFLFC